MYFTRTSSTKSWLHSSSRPQHDRRKQVVVSFVLLLLIVILYLHTIRRYFQGAQRIEYFSPKTKTEPVTHPISRLIDSARAEFSQLDGHGVKTLDQAAKAYRERRGRQPPPEFDQWVSFALSRNSSLSEVFFDQIYEDLEPFWSQQPSALRTFATNWVTSISIREGQSRFRINPVNHDHEFEWVKLWMEALSHIPYKLPDMDIALNNFDEPRIIVPWEDMAEHMRIASESRHTGLSSNETIVDSYASYPNLTEYQAPGGYQLEQDDGTIWHKARRACPPESPAKTKEVNETGIPQFESVPDYDYVKNLTSSRYVCDQPDLYNLHAAYVRPDSPPTTKTLHPLFSACKLTGINNDILLPAAQYMNEKEMFSGGAGKARHSAWEKKKPRAFWRGSNSGGELEERTWRYFQRPRLASMMNGTQVGLQEELMSNGNAALTEVEALANPAPFDFPWPHAHLAALRSRPTTLGAWVSSMSESGLLAYDCGFWKPDCTFMKPYFRIMDKMPMHEMFQYKFLPDVDGFSYSGRYNGFLDSSSLPIKATVYTEWHRSRLVPWYHFVPMDNTYRDWWGIMEYFAGYDSSLFNVDKALHREAHDEQARTIAMNGMDWSAKHLRKDDMIVYIYRLLLEYARICDDRRDAMGWVGDLHSG